MNMADLSVKEYLNRDLSVEEQLLFYYNQQELKLIILKHIDENLNSRIHEREYELLIEKLYRLLEEFENIHDKILEICFKYWDKNRLIKVDKEFKVTFFKLTSKALSLLNGRASGNLSNSLTVGNSIQVSLNSLN